MLFSGITFLYYFLPLTLLVYFLVPKRGRNCVLLIASLFFYAWGEQAYAAILLISTVVDYVHGLLVERCRSRNNEKGARLALISSVVFNLGILFFFKYWDFFANSLASVGLDFMPVLGISLPIGISFYTFQTMSYTIDVYRGNVRAQRNILHFGTFVTMFPQLVAGPIVRYAEVESRLKERSTTLHDAAEGVQRFVLGLGKKVLLANQLGELCAFYRDSGAQTALFAWIYAIAFTLQIYFDFSGYSDMAIGLGKLLGFHFPENFNYPYISKSITEFWRRWHMTLGGWFRDYVYIPLGGNRCSKLKWMRNLAIVWLLTGLWHGAAWNFVLWGAMYGVLLMVEKLWLGKRLEKLPSFVSRLYTLLFVVLGFVIFNTPSMAELGADLGKLVGIGTQGSLGETLYYLRSYGVVLLLGLAGATPLPKYLLEKLRKKRQGAKLLSLLTPVALLLLLLLCTAYLVDSSFNPFLYFRF